MKLTRILTPKNCIQKKINKRTSEKLRHVEIYDLVNKKDEAFLKENIMPLASFARKRHLGLSFTNGEGLFKNQTIMRVYEKKWHHTGGELPMSYHTFAHVASGFANISKRGNNPRAIIESLKDEAIRLFRNKQT